MKSSWADVVKNELTKGVEEVSSGVKMMTKCMNEKMEIGKREKYRF